MKRHHVGRGTFVVAAVAATAFIAAAPLQPTDNTTAPDPAGTAGMWVHIDNETGDLQGGPDASVSAQLELDADLQNALRRDTEGLKLIRHANGATSMDLQGRYQSVSVLHIDENGVSTICTDNETGVEKARKGQITATPEVK